MKKRKFFYDTEFMEEPGFLEMISIGIVGDDGSEFYACNLDADLPRANDFVREEIIPHLPPQVKTRCSTTPWMSIPQLRENLLNFLRPSKEDPIELWGYYPAYDHVCFCWIFGIMVELPAGVPKITYDVKQLADYLGNPELPLTSDNKHDALVDAQWTKQAYDFLMDKICPACNAPNAFSHAPRTDRICKFCGSVSCCL